MCCVGLTNVRSSPSRSVEPPRARELRVPGTVQEFAASIRSFRSIAASAQYLQLPGTGTGRGPAPDLISLSATERQRPIDGSPLAGSQIIWIAFSGQALTQCSSLPQSLSRSSTATRFCVSRQAGPQASTHRPQPVQISSIIAGSHLREFSCFTVSSVQFR